MTIKRVSRPLSDVANEVCQKLKDEHGVTDKQLAQLRQRVHGSKYRFPLGGIRVPASVLWIDYEVQRDVIVKHILDLLKRWDNRICQPAACNTHPSLVELVDEARNIYRFKKLFIYDAQHRCVTQMVLGIEEIAVTVVVDSDPTFASYAFRTSNSIIKKIGPPDRHRNNLRLYKLGVHDEETITAQNLQTAFDQSKVDLLEISSRNSMSDDEKACWYFSHFDYANKPMGSDKSGKTVKKILAAMTTTWPKEEMLDNCVFIGLHRMNEAVKSLSVKLPADWMTQVCAKVAESFDNSRVLSRAAERHIKWTTGGQWSVSESMYKFMRELYRMNGGQLVIPGDGADLNLHKGRWVEPNLIPNHANLYLALENDNVGI